MTTPDQEQGSKAWFRRLDAIASIVMIGAAVVMVWVALTRTAMPAAAPNPSSPSVRLPSAPVSIEGYAAKGGAAPVVMIEYSDFQCPFCIRFSQETLPILEREFISQGKLRVVFRHLPVERIHPDSMRAALAAECARRQGRFWELHDRFFMTPLDLSESAIVSHAKQIGLNEAQFSACREGEATDVIAADAEAAAALRISSTPYFVFGKIQPDGRVILVDTIRGAQPVAVFRATIEELLR